MCTPATRQYYWKPHPKMSMKDTLLIISGLLVVELAGGCFITNCPPGGKRSEPSDGKTRQCQSCGPPDMKGVCYGSRICCTSQGCLFGTPHTVSCIQENLQHNTPCSVPGESCSGNDPANSINGQCAGKGICCSADTCTTDENCRQTPEKKGRKAFQGRDHSILDIFQNPLDRWIPRRSSLGDLQRMWRRLGGPQRESQLKAWTVPSDNLIPSNEEY